MTESTQPCTALQSVISAIHAGQRFVVVSHSRPDGDAIGSMLATTMLLTQLGKYVEMYSSDPVPRLHRWLPWASRIQVTQQISSQFDSAILLECDGIPRSRMQGLDALNLINIDHHLSGREFAHINWIDHTASACGELVYQLAIALGAEITPEMATCLYATVLTDTGGFCFGNLTASTFEFAAKLVRLGSDPLLTAREIYFKNPLSKMLLLGAALSSLQHRNGITWLSVTQQDFLRFGSLEEDCEGIVNYALGITGTQVAVFLRELPNGQIRLSLRSSGAIQVATIAETYGGGGHGNASGCTLDGPMEQATQQILAVLDKHILPIENHTAKAESNYTTRPTRP
jgi:phosphoesterase RecJ-like protein